MHRGLPTCPAIVAAMLVRVCALLLIGLAPLLAALGGVRVEAICPWGDAGDTSVIVRVTAPREADAVVQIAISAGSQSVSARVTAAAGTTEVRTIVLPGKAYSLSVSWRSERGESDRIDLRPLHSDLKLCLIDPRGEIDLSAVRTAVELALRATHGSMSSYSGYQARCDTLDPGSLPDRWQGLPRGRALLLSRSGDAALTPRQREAILWWCQQGGTLYASEVSVAERWQREGIAAPLFDVKTASAKVLALGPNQDSERQAQTLVVPGTEEVPVTAFVVIAIGFVLVVGPLNLWWLRRRGRRALFLVTTPVLSVGMCIVLIAVSVMNDGLGVRRCVVQLAVLDQAHKRLTAWTGVGYFSGLPTGAISLDGEDAVRVALQHAATIHYYSGPRSESDDELGDRRFVWDQGLRAEGSWIPARTNRQLTYTHCRPEQRRLMIERSSSGYRLTNGLGVGIAALTWRDAKGQSWGCDAVAPHAAIDLRLLNGGDLRDPMQANRAAVRRGLPDEVDRMLAQHQNTPGICFAALAAPLLSVPGPGEDQIAPETLLITRIASDGAAMPLMGSASVPVF